MNLKNTITLLLLTLILSNILVAPSSASNLIVEHVASTGIRITANDQAVLIDAMFSPQHRSTQSDKAEFKKLIENSADIVLATNTHRNHFSPRRVSSFMLQNPDAILISTPKATRKMHWMLDKHRLVSPSLDAYEAIKYQYQNIEVTAVNSPLGNTRAQKSMKNYAFLVGIGGYNVLYFGDTNINDALKKFIESSPTPIDLVVVPDACIKSGNCIDVLAQTNIKSVAFTEGLNGEPDNIPSKVLAKLPNAQFLTKANKRIELGHKSDNIEASLSAAVQTSL